METKNITLYTIESRSRSFLWFRSKSWSKPKLLPRGCAFRTEESAKTWVRNILKKSEPYRIVKFNVDNVDDNLIIVD